VLKLKWNLFQKVVQKYLDLAIEYDYTFVITKYTVQQFLGAEQRETDFLISGTMRELCAIFGREEVYIKRQVNGIITLKHHKALTVLFFV
jgi:hypothetical protein